MNEELLNDMLKTVSDEMYKILKDSMLDLSLTREEYEQKNKKKIELQLALKDNGFWDKNYLEAKSLIKEEIENILLMNYNLNSYTIDNAINFNNYEDLSCEMQFNLLMFIYEEMFGSKEKGFRHFINNRISKTIDKEYISICLHRENIELSFEDKVELLVEYIYSHYKGLNIVEPFLSLPVEEIEGGMSGNEEDGSILSSLWITCQNKKYHFTDLTFNSVSDLRAIAYGIKDKQYMSGDICQSYSHTYDDGTEVKVNKRQQNIYSFKIKRIIDYDYSLYDFYNNNRPKALGTMLEYLESLIKEHKTICVLGGRESGKTSFLIALSNIINEEILVSNNELKEKISQRHPDRYIDIDRGQLSNQYYLDKKANNIISLIDEDLSGEELYNLLLSAQRDRKSTIFTYASANNVFPLDMMENEIMKMTNADRRNIKQLEQNIVFVILEDFGHPSLNGVYYVDKKGKEFEHYS